MIYEIDEYQIRPYSNHLCWELFEYREVTCNKGDHKGEKRMDLVSLGVYPSSFGHALYIIYELQLKKAEEGKGTVTKGLKSALKHVDELYSKLERKVEGA